MNALELVIGCMSNDFLSYMKHEKKITMDENELNAILYKHLTVHRTRTSGSADEKQDPVQMIELSRENGNEICQFITSDILKYLTNKMDNIDSYIYLDIYFRMLSNIWRCFTTKC